MTLKEMIFKRKSCRSFTNIPVDAASRWRTCMQPTKKVSGSSMQVMSAICRDIPIWAA